MIDNYNLVCINNGEGTIINLTQGTTSCLDITLTSANIAAKCNWYTLDDTWGSDHYPIMIEYNQKYLINTFKATPKWSMKKANWEKFQTN